MHLKSKDVEHQKCQNTIVRCTIAKHRLIPDLNYQRIARNIFSLLRIYLLCMGVQEYNVCGLFIFQNVSIIVALPNKQS